MVIGDFDKGEFEAAFNGETVVRLKLDELNQNHASFNPSLMNTLQQSYEHAYRLGKHHAKKELLDSIKDL